MRVGGQADQSVSEAGNRLAEACVVPSWGLTARERVRHVIQTVPGTTR